ncbi:hypothetical protein HFO15_19905 [Rhizobium laguerreae]|uniref:hypothetical protein n=1 Tax=Rhizobium laguerreae TaxID=1076926 RepID=UPI001C90F1F1|nr:hypothetical protein [Rhizobium laguerreae]MBY3263893.1 hypothetical protein [Rhizobium laguerreae]
MSDDIDQRALDLVEAIFSDMASRGIVLRNKGDFESVSYPRRTQAKAAWQVIARNALAAEATT